MEMAERQRRARDGRYVSVTPASDGIAFLEARLPAEDATALDTALNVAAAGAKRADAAAGVAARTRDQRRADALAEWGWAALAACADGSTGYSAATAVGRAAAARHADPSHTPRAAGTAALGDATGQPEPAALTRSAVGGSGADRAVTAGPAGYARPAEDAASGGPPGDQAPLPPAVGSRPRRRPVSVHVTIPFTALAGLSDEPGELDGYGPIPAHTARALAAEGVWTWLATDPGTGQLLDLGRTRYRPTKALADFVIARDRTCRTPGCHRSAKAADIDHLVPFAAGGTTDPANCHALCETHHLLKHHGGWRVQRDRDGTTRWRSPTGHRYEKPPERLDPGPALQPRPPG